MLFLNYRNEADIYESDLALFQSPNWLNDHCLNFYFRWLQHDFSTSRSLDNLVASLKTLSISSASKSNPTVTEERFTVPVERLGLHEFSSDHLLNVSSTGEKLLDETVLLLDPSIVSFFMLQCNDEEDFTDLEKNIQTRKRDLIFIPITNRNSINDTSTHWSLLVLLRYESGYKFFHYDSHGAYNRSASIEVAQKFLNLLCSSSSQATFSSSMASTKGINEVGKNLTIHQDSSSPQQSNSYDCGMYVCCITRLLLVAYLTCPKDALNLFDNYLKQAVTQDFISEERIHIKQYADDIFYKSATEVEI